MDKLGYNYLIEYETLWEKEKLLATSNFSFSHNVFKICLVLMRQNDYLWSKGLMLPDSFCSSDLKIRSNSLCGQVDPGE